MHREGNLTFISETEGEIILAIHHYFQDRIKSGFKIATNPSFMMGDIQKQLGYHPSTIISHLRDLEDGGLLTIQRLGGYQHPLVNGGRGKYIFRVKLKRLKFLLNTLKTPGVAIQRGSNEIAGRVLETIYNHGSLRADLLNTWVRNSRSITKEFLNTYLEENNGRYTLSRKGLSVVSACGLLTEAIDDWFNEDSLESEKEDKDHEHEGVQTITLTTTTGSLVVESGRSRARNRSKTFYLVVSKKTSEAVLTYSSNRYHSVDSVTNKILGWSGLKDLGLDDVVCYRYTLEVDKQDDPAQNNFVREFFHKWGKENSLNVVSGHVKRLALYVYKDSDFYAFGYPDLTINRLVKRKNNPCLWSSPRERVFNEKYSDWTPEGFSQIFVEEFDSASERKERILDILRQLGEDKCVNIVNVRLVLNLTSNEPNEDDEDE